MIAPLLLLLLQAAPAPPAARTARPPRQVLPVLAFPEPGVDDSAAYEGYRTRFFRDSRGNAVQVYVDGRSGRLVQLWADSADESIGFTARDADGRPAALAWASDGATVADSGRFRTMRYPLQASTPTLAVGWLALGSMRVERDLQYARRHLEPFGAPPFRLKELDTLVADLDRLPADERRRQLALLRAGGVDELRARLRPTVTASRGVVRVVQPTLDGRNRLLLELRADPRDAEASVAGDSIVFRSRSGRPLRLTVRTATDAGALTPLRREDIFTAEFLSFLSRLRSAEGDALRRSEKRPLTAADSVVVSRYRRLERQVRSVELLGSDEKLMAGLPNYATYFGRDMMMTALMMRPIWRPAMQERVIAAVLRKLSPSGRVSHEEALGGQAIRENAVVYDSLVRERDRLARAGEAARADSALAGARAVLRDLQAVRENYNMMDGELQLPVLVAWYLADSTVPAARKRAFLLARERGGPTRASLLLRELGHLAALTAPYAASGRVLDLISFPRRDSTHWRSASWRDSDAGYAGGRFAMDINAIWAPRALAATAGILSAMRTLGLAGGGGAAADDGLPAALAEYVRDSAALGRAVAAWEGARGHFTVALGPAEIGERVAARLGALPEGERAYWERILTSTGAARDSIVFAALALDSAGAPIPVVNTDPATGLFLSDVGARVARGTVPADAALREVDPFLRPYPVGLFVDRLGPVVSNDAYAPPRVWAMLAADSYHGPRVVWGREVNLLVLGLARQIAAASDSAAGPRGPAAASYVHWLQDALRHTRAAVEASGLQQGELWSYRIEDGRLRPTRYGISSDLQLWTTADLAVQFVLSRLPRD